MVNKPVLERRFFPQGKIIVEKGEEALTAFLIQSGRARVFTIENGRKITLSELEAGDIFGETALVLDKERSASVEASTDCTVVVITRQVFKSKLANSDPMIRTVTKMFGERISKANSEVVKSKGVNVDSFIALLNQLFKDLLESMPDDKKANFKNEAFPTMNDLIQVIEKYRDYLS